MSEISIKVALTPKGAFNVDAAYETLDIVTYSGAPYIITADKAAGAWDVTKAMALLETGLIADGGTPASFA